MNRRDFEMVARVVKTYNGPIRTPLAFDFAKAIEGGEGNSGFDRAKFLKQCGVADAKQS